jgi:hypothetical protein
VFANQKKRKSPDITTRSRPSVLCPDDDALYLFSQKQKIVPRVPHFGSFTQPGSTKTKRATEKKQQKSRLSRL